MDNVVKIVSILQSNYIPWRGYFDIMRKSDVFVIYDEVQYTKNDWRNRNVIQTKVGSQWLTIPVKQKSLSQTIKDTKIASNNWTQKHWNAIQLTYAKANHFSEYETWLSELYSEVKHYESLSEVNVFFLTKILKKLDIHTEIINSEDLHLKGDKNEKLIDSVIKLKGNCYLSGPAAKSYLDIDLFQRNGISVEWMDYSNYAPYQQWGGSFNGAVSILDTIAHCGTDLKTIYS
jgi:hypothetical protein